MNPYRQIADDAYPLFSKKKLRLVTLAPGDADDLIDLVDRCSEESRFSRFHTCMAALRPAMADKLVSLDPDRGLALGLRDRRGRLIAEGRYARTSEHVAEVAALVADSHQSGGLGTALLAVLFDHAADSGVLALHAEILPSNDAIAAVLGRLAPVETLGIVDGVRQLCMPLGEVPCPVCAPDVALASA